MPAGSILQLLYRILADLKSRHHSQMEVECEGNKGEKEKGMCAYELGEDILVEIFSRLPVKLVFQLKSVCRSWNAIVSSPYLASMHLRNYTNGPAGNASQSLIVSKFPEEYFLYAEQLYPDDAEAASKIRPLDIPLPMITGPSNGVFLLGCTSGPCHLYMWNPATGGFRELPLPKPREITLLEDVEMSCNSCGFGLDTVANDLKLVVIRHFHLESSCCPFPGRNPMSSLYLSPKFPSQLLVYTLHAWDRYLEGVRRVQPGSRDASFPEILQVLEWVCVLAMCISCCGTDIRPWE